MSVGPLAIERPLSLDNPLEMDDARVASRRASMIRHEGVRDYLRLQKEAAELNSAFRQAKAKAWVESLRDAEAQQLSAEGRKLWVEARVAAEELTHQIKLAEVKAHKEYLDACSEERSQLKSLIEWSMRLDPSWQG